MNILRRETQALDSAITKCRNRITAYSKAQQLRLDHYTNKFMG